MISYKFPKTEVISPQVYSYSNPKKNIERFKENEKMCRGLEQFGEGEMMPCEEFNIMDILEKFKKKSHLEKKLRNYSLNLHFGMGYFNKKNLFADAPYQFILYKRKKPIALLGFEPNEKFLFVIQIQGVKKMKRKLKPIKWSNALLNIATEWASKRDLSEIYVLPAERNQWSKVRENIFGAKMYYDVTAKREKFKYDSKKGVFKKKLK